jgi:hypothetical protein
VSPTEYRDALDRLGLTQVGAGAVLGISPRAAQYYAARGPTGPAALAIRLLLELPAEQRARWISPS